MHPKFEARELHWKLAATFESYWALIQSKVNQFVELIDRFLLRLIIFMGEVAITLVELYHVFFVANVVGKKNTWLAHTTLIILL